MIGPEPGCSFLRVSGKLEEAVGCHCVRARDLTGKPALYIIKIIII